MLCFKVLDKYNPPDDFLPESYTCFFLLKMPRYSSRAVLRAKLKYAIHFCKSIDTDDYARIALTADHMQEMESESSGDDEAEDEDESEDEDVRVMVMAGEEEEEGEICSFDE